MSEELKEELAEETVEETAEPAEKEPKKKAKKTDSELLAAQKELESVKAELAALNDTYLRLAAEYDNFRRRSQKEREGVYGEAYADALAALFPVVDNLERAVQFSDGDSVQKGVSMTLASVKETLQKLGVTEINPVGETFDPNFHNAVLHVEDETVGESVVVEVLQKGYARGDRVLRYAMVKVAN